MDTALIPLCSRDGTVHGEALVDAADVPLLQEHRWRLAASIGYAVRNIHLPDGRWTLMYMHRQILGLEVGDRRHTDHINRNRLDNRRANIRVCSVAENQQNKPSCKGSSSRYRGVVWNKQCRKWQAQARMGTRLHYLGLFEDEDEANRVVTAWRLEHMTHSVETLV